MSSSRISKVARGPRSVGAGVRGDNSVARQQLVQFVADDLRLHRRLALFALLLQALAPLAHALLCRFHKAPVLVRPEQREQRAERGRGISHQAALDGIAKPDPRAVSVDLHRAEAAGLVIMFDIRRAAADDKQRIAGQQRLRALPIGSLAVYMSLMKTLILAALVLLLSTRAAARARDRNRPNRNAACEGRPGAAGSQYA